MWEDPAEQLITGIAQTDATILEAHSDDEWVFRVRFENHTGFARFNQYCEDHDLTYQLTRVSSLSEADPDHDDYGLTETQYEALLLAVDRGYFKVPREVEYKELAEELGLSVQAFSERVRCALDKVLHQVLDQSNP